MGEPLMLTTELLQRFVGGQAEIYKDEDYVFRGEIKTIAVEDGDVQIRFAWFAKADGYPPMTPVRWIRDDRLDYRASLLIYTVSDMDSSGHDVDGDRGLCLKSCITGETVNLYTTNGSKLNPARVIGLELPSKE